jgi:hypothetical protein
MPPTPTEIYGMQSPLDFRPKWNSLQDMPLFDEAVLGSGPLPASAPHSHPHSPTGLESEMMSMLMHSSFEFLEPAIDPASLGPLSPAYPLEQCNNGVMLSDAVDPWSISQYPYLDLSPHTGTLLDPPQLTPSMSSSSESSLHSTPQLSHPHFGLGSVNVSSAPRQGGFLQMHEPHYGTSASASTGFASSVPDRAGMQFLPHGIDPQDPRLAAALAMCDPYGASAHGLHGLSHMGSLLGHHQQHAGRAQ